MVSFIHVYHMLYYLVKVVLKKTLTSLWDQQPVYRVPVQQFSMASCLFLVEMVKMEAVTLSR